MATPVTLAQMTDLALGTPEVGAVNFTVLHGLLHAILQKLQIAESTTVIDPRDKEFLARQSDKDVTDGLNAGGEAADRQPSALSKADTGFSDNDSVISSLRDPSSKQSVRGSTPYHQLEEKVAKLQQQMDQLNSLPSNKELFERTQATGSGSGDKQHPVSDMWQLMQLTKRVSANEEGISKLMSLMEDVMRDIRKLKDRQDDLSDSLNKLSDKLENGLKNQTSNEELDALRKLIEQLQKDLAEAKEFMKGLTPLNYLDNFVTWEALEQALKGIKDAQPPPPEPVKARTPPPQRIVIEMAMQTDERGSKSQTQNQSYISEQPISRRASTPGPSAQLQELLERLGRLTDLHDALEERVRILEEEIKKKADRDMLDKLNLSDDVLKMLNDLQKQLETLKQLQAKDGDRLNGLLQTLRQLQAEMERLDRTVQQVAEDNLNKTKQIGELFVQCQKLDEVKADKEYVQQEVETKANKDQLDAKVNRKTFEDTRDELNRLINDILARLAGNEEEWRRMLAQLARDLDGKCDRAALAALRDELERQLKALLKRLNALNFNQQEQVEDDAAGIRRQLVQRFHCISCDRTVDMAPQMAVPSIPEQSALPTTRSSRPYTTYELAQIRQQAKTALQSPMFDGNDVYATNRSAGGSYTLTYPHRRVTRMQHLTQLFQEEPTVKQEEKDIIGSDGHMYKGRLHGNANGKLPGIQQHLQQPRLARGATDLSPVARNRSPRPTTVNGPSPRPMSAGAARPRSRPQSAADHTTQLLVADTVIPSASFDGVIAPAASETNGNDVAVTLPEIAASGD